MGATLLFAVGLSGCNTPQPYTPATPEESPKITVLSGLNKNHIIKTKKDDDHSIKVKAPKGAKYIALSYYQGMIVDTFKVPKSRIVKFLDQADDNDTMILYALKKEPKWNAHSDSIKHPIATLKYKYVITNKSDDDDDSSSYSSSSSSSKPKTTPKPRKKAFDRSEYSTAITYDQLARTPDQYEDKLVALTGKVIQVLDGKSETDLRVAINGNYDDVVIVAYDPDIMHGKRVLENDKIIFYGKSYGVTTYKSTIGEKITVPLVIVKVIDDDGEAPDDYGE